MRLLHRFAPRNDFTTIFPVIASKAKQSQDFAGPPGIAKEKIDLQQDDSKAKAYQVRQTRAVILKYKLGGELEDAEV